MTTIYKPRTDNDIWIPFSFIDWFWFPSINPHLNKCIEILEKSRDETYTWPKLWIFPEHTLDKSSTERRNIYHVSYTNDVIDSGKQDE